MKGKIQRSAQAILIAATAVLGLCATCWAGPPAPPTIPSTPVGNLEVSALTAAAVAAYGYWKNRK